MEPFTFEPNPQLAVPDVVQRRLYQGAYDLFGTTQAQLASADRTRTPSLARQAVALTLRHWDRSITLAQLAVAMYRTDHTTARYALEHGLEEYQKAITFRARVDVMRARVGVRGLTEAPAENTVDELVYLRSENERLQALVDSLMQTIASVQLQTTFVSVQMLPAMVREKEVGQ